VHCGLRAGSGASANRARSIRSISSSSRFITVEPYSKAQRVFLIVDNGLAHRGKASIKRLQGAWKNLIVVHTLVHASWPEPVRDLFLDRAAKGAATQQLRRTSTNSNSISLAFGRRYEQIAKPFEWKFIHRSGAHATRQHDRQQSPDPSRVTHPAQAPRILRNRLRSNQFHAVATGTPHEGRNYVVAVGRVLLDCLDNRLLGRLDWTTFSASIC
jgi:hypothetical protein